MFNERYDYRHDYAEEFHEKYEENANKIRTWSIVIAILMIVVGVLCFIFPSDAFSAMTVVAGIVLIVMGIAELVAFYRMPAFMRDPMALLNAVFSFLAAVLLFVMPVYSTAAALGIIFAFMLLSSGFEKLGLGWRMSFYAPDEKHTGLTVSAVVDIVLAVVFFIMPITGITAVGYLIAAYLVVAGIALLIEGISFKVNKKKQEKQY